MQWGKEMAMDEESRQLWGREGGRGRDQLLSTSVRAFWASPATAAGFWPPSLLAQRRLSFLPAPMNRKFKALWP